VGAAADVNLFCCQVGAEAVVRGLAGRALQIAAESDPSAGLQADRDGARGEQAAQRAASAPGRSAERGAGGVRPARPLAMTPTLPHSERSREPAAGHWRVTLSWHAPEQSRCTRRGGHRALTAARRRAAQAPARPPRRALSRRRACARCAAACSHSWTRTCTRRSLSWRCGPAALTRALSWAAPASLVSVCNARRFRPRPELRRSACVARLTRTDERARADVLQCFMAPMQWGKRVLAAAGDIRTHGPVASVPRADQARAARRQELADSERRWTVHPLMEQLKGRARAEGLWNLWVSPSLAACVAPGALAAAGDRSGLLGAGLSNLVRCCVLTRVGLP